MDRVISKVVVLELAGGLAAVRLPVKGRYPYKVMRSTAKGLVPVSLGFSTAAEALVDLGLRTGTGGC